MIRIITIEREYGCGGAAIAKKVADELRWKLWDQLFTSEIARLANCSKSQVEIREERVDPLYYRLFKSILLGSFEGSINLNNLKMLDADSILRITQQVVETAAKDGNAVIVGRGSQQVLRDRDDTLRIFLYAPSQAKIDRLKSEGIDERRAKELVETIDKDRGHFVEKYFNIKWPDRSTYHAMLNTTTGEDATVRMILDLKSALDPVPAH
ncbi:MAG TPA: cytidylate kinase-like family protein [Terriglobales bacterium]